MSPEFKNPYSDYLLGEVRDQLVFYYTDHNFEMFLKFFEYLEGLVKFNYEQYLRAFEDWRNYLDDNVEIAPKFSASADAFLQFLYELNVISFEEEAEDEKFIRLCFRERSPTNISPKVRVGASYEIHYGLTNALNTGKALRGRGRTGPKKERTQDGDRTKGGRSAGSV